MLFYVSFIGACVINASVLINRRQGTINYVCLQVVLVACDGHDRLIKSKLMLLEGGLCYHTWPRNPRNCFRNDYRLLSFHISLRDC